MHPFLSKRLSKSLTKSCDTFVSQHWNKLKWSQISGDNISLKRFSSQTYNSEIFWVRNILARMPSNVLHVIQAPENFNEKFNKSKIYLLGL